LCIIILGLLGLTASAQQEYTFDISEVEKRPFHFGGYLEFRPVLFGLDKSASFYLLRFYNQDEGKSVTEYNFLALLDASYEKGIIGAKIRTNTDVKSSFSGWSSSTKVYEAFFSLKPSLFFQIDIGKKRMKWGKGYAWNPVAFIDKHKDPNDPELALEGFTVISLDYTRSFKGPLKTITVTPFLLPVVNHINSGFGELNNLNFGGKIYFLFYDTDIDFMFLSGGSVPDRFGFDFSRNIISNLEIHGEFSLIPNFRKQWLDYEGNLREKQYSSKSILTGIRFLTKTNTTLFLEYYKNGGGFTSQEMDDIYLLVENGYNSFLLTGNDSLLKLASGPLGENYRKFTPMRDYIYLRISQKEPFNILYFIPSLTSIINLNDNSYSLVMEMLYTPITNLELRVRGATIFGKEGSEFGEKQNDFRLEIRGRYYF
jgi:hypothetical protein